MSREKDTRDYSRPRGPIQGLPEVAVRFAASPPSDPRLSVAGVNTISGTPISLSGKNMAPPEDYVAAALTCVRSQFKDALGFASAEPEYVPDPYVQRTSAGTAVVHLHQQYRGIPLFEMTRAVQFGPDHSIVRVVGDNVSVTTAPATAPALTAADALRLAAGYLAAHDEEEEEDEWGQPQPAVRFDVPADYVPRVVSSFDRPDRPTVLECGPFEKEVQASLVYFCTSDLLRLCWRLLIGIAEPPLSYLMLMAADRAAGDVTAVDDVVLLCQRTCSAISANVFLHNPGTGGRERVEMPRPVATYPLNGTHSALPHPLPRTWWVEADATAGNCAVAVEAADQKTFAGRVVGEALEFDPPQADGDEQCLLNAFFFCNYMHDFFYLLGFDEAAGNFQRVNFKDGGAGNDAVRVRIHGRHIHGTARFQTRPDGSAATMDLGLLEGADGIARHTALDSDVVFHEYVHGVTRRVIGGRMGSFALQQPQSAALGEGWGDYFALTIQNHGKAVEKVVIGDWVKGAAAGFRRAPYDENYPNTYGRVGTPGFTAAHEMGELWCAILMQMNRNLDAALGAPRGRQFGWQIVFDGFKLSRENPSFLDARDAIVDAIEDRRTGGRLSASDYAAALKAAWTAFTRFGLGAAARTHGASLHGIVEDFTMPAGV